ncbi:MAG: hypothetical protein H6739_04600 [Alphaproteobacteria bacterium]|nr:hypothetical protein [Alphaproteobacteria bacterium]
MSDNNKARSEEELSAIDYLADHAIHFLDTQDALGEAMHRTYKAGLEFVEVYKCGRDPDPRPLLKAFGGLQAMLGHVRDQAENLERVLDEMELRVVALPETPKDDAE